EGPGDEGGADEDHEAAQGAVDVALAVEVPAATERADLDAFGAPALGGDGARLAAAGAGERSRAGVQAGAPGEGAVAAAGAGGARGKAAVAAPGADAHGSP